MLTNLINFIIRSPLHTVIAAAFLAYIPILSFLSAAIVALSVLQQRLVVSSMVFLAGALPVSVIAILQYGDYMLLAIYGISAALALVLRFQASWEKVFLYGLPLVIAINWLLFNPDETQLAKLFTMMFAGVDINKINLDYLYLVVNLLFSAYMFVPLLIARWFQAHLYDGNKFRDEFHAIRISIVVSLSLCILAGIIWLSGFNNIATSILVPFIFSGLALMHYLINHKNMPNFWLIIFYFVILTLNYAVFIVVMLGVLDSILDIRKRIK